MKRVIAVVTASVMALSAIAADKPEIAIRKQLKTNFPDLEFESIEKSPYAGLYQMAAGGDVFYVSPDGKFLIYGGTMLGLGTQAGQPPINLTQTYTDLLDKKRAPERSKILNAPDMVKSTLTFAAAKPQHEVFVFTDIDCGYCQKLHHEMKAINDLGITVHYLAFPRAGLNSPSHEKLASVWCSENPQKAMTAAKSGQVLQSRSCENPIEKHYSLVHKFGLSGTPAIILKDGTLLPGYLPPDRLLNEIKKRKS